MSAPKAFVLMPFDADFDNVYSQLIEPALTDLGFSVTRADLSINQQQILKDIVNSLAEADLVIVDVSGLNGNVMYELGLAHAMGKRTVMITRDISELPFDLRSYRANAYSTEFTEAPKLRERLATIGAGVLDGSAEFSNPVQDFAPEFLGQPDQVAIAPTKVDHGAAIGAVADEEEPGLLDFAVELSESSAELVAIGERIGTATATVGNQMTARTAQIELLNKNLGSNAAPALRQLMRETANDFDKYSEELESQNPLLHDALSVLGLSANGLARSRSTATPEEEEKLREEIDSFAAAEVSFDEAYENISTFASIIGSLPPMEKKLTAAVRRAASAVNATADEIALGKSEFARVRGLLEERLDTTA